MPEIHILNVGSGDCIIMKHGSGRITMFDICSGNISAPDDRAALNVMEKSSIRGNFQMCKKPTNPLRFLKDEMGVTKIFRFILSHPDMDHLDGFDSLMNNFHVSNFWDSGVRKDKPDFSGGPYKEEDWDRYQEIIDGEEDGINVISPLADSKNKFFNKDDKDGGGDFTYLYAPTSSLVKDANNSSDDSAINDASYVIVYRTAGGRILLAGDSHDKTWEHILQNYKEELIECEVMIAPHHGRDSNRDWTFLDIVEPQLSVLGCASSKHLAYEAWNNRNLAKITQNQAGNIAIYPSTGKLDIYVENKNFAEKLGVDTSIVDSYGNAHIATVMKSNKNK